MSKNFSDRHGHHQAGRIPQADKLYRQILAQQPKHAGALQYLGMIAHQLDRNDIAVDLIRQAIAVKPTAEAYYNLGIVLSQAGQPEEAVAVYRQAISLKPNNPDAFINLGNAPDGNRPSRPGYRRQSSGHRTQAQLARRP